LSKVADVIGRFEAFSIAIFILVIGYVQDAASDNVRTYAAAQIFYAAGSQGLQVLQQVFVADTTDLLHRALFATLFNVPFLWTVWVGSPLAQYFLTHSSWRWGYGIWAIVLPVAFLPLAIVLFTNKQKAKRAGRLPPSVFSGKSSLDIAKQLWLELDVFGLLLLCGAIFLILIPLTLAPSAKGGWLNPSIFSMLVVGVVCLGIFPFWERSETLAPHAFFPKSLFMNRTVIAGAAIAFFYFSKFSSRAAQTNMIVAFYLSIFPYFTSYLLIVQGQSVTVAGRVSQTFSFSITITAFIVSMIIKYTAHYKYLVTLGACVYVVSLGLIVRYRQPGAGILSLVGSQIAIGIGGGLITVPAQLGVQASVSHQQVASATSAFLTILEIGGAVGSAISGAIWSSLVPQKLETYLPLEIKDQARAIYQNVTLASTGWPMGSPERDAINRAYQETMTLMLIVACCIALPLLPLSFVMKNYKLDQMDQHVKGKVIGSGIAEEPRPMMQEAEPLVQPA
jgi:MFS family permease